MYCALSNAAVCESGFCDDADDGQCIGACVTDADCGGNLICTDSHLGNVAGRWCAEPCEAMAECGFDAADANSRICKRRCDDQDPVVANRGFELVCTPPVGTRDLNAVLVVTATTCAVTADCPINQGLVCNANGLCAENAILCKSGFSVTSGGATYCSQPCLANNECGAGLQCSFVSTSTCGGNDNPDITFCRRN